MSDTCPHCGAKTVRYIHGMNVGLLIGLQTLHAAGGGPINLGELQLSRSEWDNFQKLRYWELVRKSGRAGEWEITALGRAFVMGLAPIPSHVKTYRAKPVSYATTTVWAGQVVEGYKQRPQWAQEAEPFHQETTT